MTRLVLLRHGQSLWNQAGRFTGWTDIDLSPKGVEEARNAGRLLRSCGCTFDLAYTSVLKRAIRTLWIVQDEMDLMWIPTVCSWRLNERCYGALEGQSKKETEERHGAEQVHRWRRGFRDRPPAMEEGESRPHLRDPRYGHLAESQIPRTESLEDTMNRMLPFWESTIAKDLNEGRSVFIASHGNTLRALVKHLDAISDDQIEEMEIPTGVPLIYELNDDLVPVDRFYLRDEADCRRVRERRPRGGD
ncbi:MAG TPA: 2,3-diphosphoglycerate-dependent phosphoglycerate mutase [Methanothrix sp.]|nr:2,3-diphosphoglycerate-dependent phosphoglycerate mutase [Methanothrix sp.]